jgi:hypothetical protein
MIMKCEGLATVVGFGLTGVFGVKVRIRLHDVGCRSQSSPGNWHLGEYYLSSHFT